MALATRRMVEIFLKTMASILIRKIPFLEARKVIIVMAARRDDVKPYLPRKVVILYVIVFREHLPRKVLVTSSKMMIYWLKFWVTWKSHIRKRWCQRWKLMAIC